MIQRRGFLAGIFAAGAGPAIVRADSLMKIVAPKIWTPNSRWLEHIALNSTFGKLGTRAHALSLDGTSIMHQYKILSKTIRSPHT